MKTKALREYNPRAYNLKECKLPPNHPLSDVVES